MAKDAVETMGTLLPDDVGGRDAVHVAVVSVRAGCYLHPGQTVTFVDPPVAGKEPVVTEEYEEQSVGIVDPFLKDSVNRGERFWLYLYPRTITSLRHNWTHPAFPEPQSANLAYVPPSKQLESEMWLRTYATNIGMPFDELMAASKDWIDHENFYAMPMNESPDIPPEFWLHLERYLGQRIEHDKREHFFSCAC